jgi:transposase-like protein
MSAAGVAGPKQQGKTADRDVVYHGSQAGRVALKERQLRVNKPRLRKTNPLEGEEGEVEIPAYAAMHKDGRLADRMLEILIAGVSTRRYEHVIPQMAETVGISKSEVSRENIDAGERLLKHVLGMREGATENAEVAKALLEDLVARGLKSSRPRLFIIDGSKALRAAIDAVFGSKNHIQRCRNHKMRNVIGHLPEDQHDQARATLRAAFKLEAKPAIAKLEQYASWLEQDWPAASSSLKEGLEDLFTINRLGLPSSLRRGLGTTNIIDNTHSGVRDRVRRVTNGQSGTMALRWVAAAFDSTSKNVRRIMGHEQLGMLKAALDEPARDESLAQGPQAG